MKLHKFELLLTDEDLEKVYRRYNELEQPPVSGEVIDKIDREIGALACAGIKIDLRIAARMIELETLLEEKRGAA